MDDIFVAGFEAKAAGAPDSGEFEGYGAVFGNVDWHGDVIVAGAFAAGLTERKAAGRRVAMHFNHGLPQLLGRRGVGVWTHIAEDSRGLEVKGRISGMNTEAGRGLYEAVKDGAVPGLSIGFVPRPGGAEFGMKAANVVAGAKRALRAVDLHEISLVDDPSNAQSLVLQVKAQGLILDKDRMTAVVRTLMALHQDSMAGQNSPTAAQRGEMRSNLEDMHEMLTGSRQPHGTKAAPSTIREFEGALREIGFSHSQARDIAATGFTQTQARDESGGQAKQPEVKSGFAELMAALGSPVSP